MPLLLATLSCGQSRPLTKRASETETFVKPSTAEAPPKSAHPKELADQNEVAPKVAAPPPRPFKRSSDPLFPTEGERLVVLETSTWAQATPFADGERIGMVRGGAPIGYQSTVTNDDCETAWVEVVPRGFVCMEVRAPTGKDIKAAERRRQRAAKKGKKRGMSGSYAIAGKSGRFYRSLKAAQEDGRSRPARGDMLRKTTVIKTEDGRSFWKTQRGEYIEATHVRRLWGSKFEGIDLSTRDGAVAFAVHRRSVKGSVTVRWAPSESAGKAGKLRARTVVDVHETSADGSFVRISDGKWVARVDLRVVETMEPPAEVGRGSNNLRWADVDLEQQLVVVYEGKKPVFATLASSGRAQDPTPHGVYRVTRKKIRTTMASDRSRRQTYSAAVPWSTYFHEGYAFHTAYWHDSFGKARSHGCVNLSPRDAYTVYNLLGPEVPDGWTVVYGHPDQLGSVVRVRDPKAPALLEAEEAVATRATR